MPWVPSAEQVSRAREQSVRAARYRLRDEFASSALKGIITAGAIQPNGVNGWGLVNCQPSDVAGLAYELADAMLAERERKEEGR